MIAMQKSRVRSSDRKPTQTDKTPVAISQPIPAPLGGWVDGIKPGNTARVMENAFPTTTGVRIRGGSAKAAFITDPAVAMFTYVSGPIQKMFAATETDVYEVTLLNPATAPAADISAQTGGQYVASQLGTVGGDYMYIVNGSDNAQLYDGTSWTQITGASSPAITGVNTDDLSYVWTHKNRYWFIEEGTNSAWYLPVDSIGGAALEVSLDGVFQDGGSLLFGATWSQDAGDGMDDRQIFVSTTGEVAVYQGADPSNAATWSMVGLYDIEAPLGKKAHIRAGGDVLIATKVGLIPMSAVVTKDPEALGINAVSSRIQDSWRNQGNLSTAAQPWELIKWPREQMLFTTLPHDSDENWVTNLNTGAWAKYIGWDAQTMAVFNDLLYFGSSDGYIYAAESTGSDDGAAYTVNISFSPNDFGGGSSIKVIDAMRAAFMSTTAIMPQLSVSTDYAVKFPAAPTISSSATTDSAWDSGLWDTATWSDDGVAAIKPIYQTRWVSVGANGFVIAPQIQLSMGGPGRPDAELVSIDCLYTIGTAVT